MSKECDQAAKQIDFGVVVGDYFSIRLPSEMGFLMEDYAVIGYYKSETAKKYVGSIYTHSCNFEDEVQEATHFPCDIAPVVASWLKTRQARARRDGAGEKWFIETVKTTVDEQEV